VVKKKKDEGIPHVTQFAGVIVGSVCVITSVSLSEDVRTVGVTPPLCLFLVECWSTVYGWFCS
jgi:hypothetical protein